MVQCHNHSPIKLLNLLHLLLLPYPLGNIKSELILSLTRHGLPSEIPSEYSPIKQWGELNDIARREKIDIAVKSINGNQLMIDLPLSSRGAFTIAARENGWRYANMDGALRIWK